MKENYQDGTLALQLPGLGDSQFNIEVRSRGNTRKRACRFPPLRLKVKKKELKALNMDSTFNDLKLVLQCRSNKDGAAYLLKEQLIYELQKQVSPLAFHTRLIRLEIYSGEKLEETLLAFLIEKEEEYAHRLNAQVLEAGRLNDAMVDREAYVNLCFFEYMIRNTDWQVSSRHNIEWVKLPDEEQVSPVPYDFDYAGLVHTDYAIPNSQTLIKEVTQPYFMGEDIKESEARLMAQHFLDKKEQLLATVRAFEHLSKSERRYFEDILNDFFKLLEQEDRMLKEFCPY